MYAFTMKNAFNLFVEKELSGVIAWTELNSYMDSRSSFMPGMFQETIPVKEVNRFVIDVDSCLDRLYGGFDVDWKCGGDWIPMINFFGNLKRCAQMHNMQFVFIFNGTIPDTLQERSWADLQLNTRKNIYKIFREPECKEVRFWSAPIFLAELLRFEIDQKDWEHSLDTSGAPRAKNQTPQHRVFQHLTTVDDHQKEILRFCYQNKCRGLITSDYGLIALSALEKCSLKRPDNLSQLRVFLGRNLRFSENFGLHSYEVDTNELISRLKLNLSQFGCFSILVGLSSYIPDSFLIKFYEALIDKPNLVINSQIIAFKIIDEIAGFCTNIQHYSDFPKLVITMSKGLDDKYLAQHLFVNAIRRTQTSVRDDPSNFFYLEAHAKRKLQKSCKYGFFNGVPMLSYSQQEPVNSHKTGQRSGSLPRSNLKIDQEATSRTSGNCHQWVETLKLNHIESRSHCWVYHLLVSKKVYLPVTFEPETCTNMLRADELYKHLRTVGYSILLGNAYPGKGGEYTVTEVMFDTLKDKLFYDTVQFTAASSAKTAFQHHMDSAKARKSRLDLFLNAVSCPPQMKRMLEKTHRHYHKIFLACLLLRYILGYRQFLRAKDIRAFLATIIITNRINNFTWIRSAIKEHQSKIKYHSRAMHLSHLFVRGLETLHFVDQVCGTDFGRSFYLPRLFHGTLFHLFYCLYNTDQEALIGLNREESLELEELYFSITCDLTSNLIIDPIMSPYELKPVATGALLFTPTSLNKSFFGSPNTTTSVSDSKFSPNKQLANEPSMLHIGAGRGILAVLSAPKTMIRPGRSTITEWKGSAKPASPKKEEPPVKEKDTGIAFLDFDHLFNFYYDHYSMIELYREREEDAMIRANEAKRPKTLRPSATEILAKIGIYETPEDRREQLKKLKQERLVNYLRESLKPDANNKVKACNLLPISFPFHRGVTKDQLRGCIEFTYRDDMFPLCEHPQENLLVHGHTRMPHIAFKRPF